LPGGNSGEVMSAHYQDQLPLWLKGKLKDFVVNMDMIRQKKYPTTRLLPKKESVTQ
jgi:acyl-homoserine lactone acylase PvdQ